MPGAAVQAAASQAASVELGRKVYEAACVACHGPTGGGMPQYVIGFRPPSTFPDFSDCRSTAPEYTRDWRATIINGGRARGFSEIMPAFGDALTAEQISAVIHYLRSLCTDSSWPLGELNPPRAQVTEKAFPEDEVVLTSEIDATRVPGVTNTFTYEWQFSARNELEAELPLDLARADDAAVEGGIGDVVAGVKHVLFFNLDSNGSTGSILSVQGEVVLPTGSPSRDLGTGELAFGSFVAYDLILPANTYLQIQAGGQVPRHVVPASRSVYLNTALGTSFFSGGGLGRIWSPMVELIVNRDLQPGAVTDLDLIPQIEVSLSTRQHVSANLGFRIAVNDTKQRSNEVMLYVLWDTLDGSLFSGW